MMMSPWIAAPWLTGEPGQAPQAAAPAASANSNQLPILRAIRPSFTISPRPPARQASRGQPAGTSCASAQTASAQSRRPAGTSRIAPRPAAAAIRLVQLMARRAPRLRAPPGIRARTRRAGGSLRRG